MELHQLASGLTRRKTFVVLCALLGLVLAAIGMQFLGAGQYLATATLLLDPNAVTSPQQQPFIGDPERYVDGQLRLLQSNPLAVSAAEKIAEETGESIAASVTFTQVTGSDLVDVTATASTAQLARDRANALVTTYVEQRRAETKATVDGQLASVRDQLRSSEAKLAATTSSAQAQERGLLLNQYQTLIAQETTLATPGVTRDLTAVVDPAVLPTSPEKRPTVRLLALGLFAGAGVGVSASVLAEARNPLVGTTGQVERTVGAPTLAHVRRSSRLRRSAGRSIPRRMRADARRVASVLLARPALNKPRVVAVTGVGDAVPPDGLCTALQQALAEQGLDAVVLVLNGLPPESLELASGEAFSGDGTGVLPRAASGEGALRDDQVRAFVEDLPSHHEVVLLHLPQVLGSPLPVATSRWVDDVLLVVDIRHARQHELDLAWSMLGENRSRCHVVSYS